MIAMRVRVDQCRDGFVREFFDLVENRLSPTGIFGVDNKNAIGLDKDRRISAAAGQNE